MSRETGRFATLGGAGSGERRHAERSMIIDAWLELAVGAVKAELDSGWIGHEHSPLTAKRHRAAVLKRIARHAEEPGGKVDAAIVAGRYLLTVDALAEEYFRPESRARRFARVLRALGRGPARNDNGRAAR